MAAARTRMVEIEPQARDIQLLRDLYVSRIMTLAHVAALHFGGRREAAKKRLQKLKAAGFIRERPRKAREPGILFLAKRGFDALHHAGALADLPAAAWPSFERRANVSPITLLHELAVMNVKAALAPAINADAALSVIEFTTWPLLCEFTTMSPDRTRPFGPVQVRPDGMLRVLERGGPGADPTDTFEHAFFLEIDRGSETLDTLAFRIACYREHYSGGGYAASLGATGGRDAIAEYPFRVLMVFPSEERRNNAAERFLQIKPAIRTLAWLTTADQLIDDPMGAVWMRPQDYADATRGTPFDPLAHEAPRSHPARAYRRRVDREAHIRAAVSKMALFDPSPALSVAAG